MNQLNKEIRQAARGIAKSYYVFRKQIEEFDKKDSITEKEVGTYQMNIFMVGKIKDCFEYSINEYNKAKVWNYFYGRETVEDYEKKEINKEIDRWLYYLAKELNWIKE